MLKLILKVQIILLLLVSCSETAASKGYHLIKINEAEVDQIEIKKNLYDSMSVQMNKNEMSRFAEIVNTDSPAELRKGIPIYWVFVKYKSDSVRLFKITDNYIGTQDVYVRTDQAKYFMELYEAKKKEEALVKTN